jgi:diguanylate cyclase (GGDEF)-like protein
MSSSARSDAVVWRCLGALYAAGGLLGFVSIVVGLRPDAHAGWIAATSGAAIVFGAAYVVLAERLPSLLIGPMLAAGILLISVSVLAQGAGVGGYVLFYGWVGIVCCNFLPRRHAFLQLSLIASVYATILVIEPVEAPITEWLMVVGSLMATWSVINLLRRRIDSLLQQLADLSAQDPLTGLLNRRGLDDALATELDRHRRTGLPLAVIAADLDWFKRLNDEHGHAAGDDMLRRFGELLRDTRPSDVAARVGGEEFVLLAPDTGVESALLLAEQLREATASALGTDGRPQTASFGVAVLPHHADDTEALLHAADRALYAAKAAGRDRVAAAPQRPGVSDPPAPPLLRVA